MMTKTVRRQIPDYMPDKMEAEDKPAYQRPAEPRKADCAEAQVVYDILEKIEMPTGKEKVYFPKGKNLPEDHRDDKGKGFVIGLHHMQSMLLGQEISKKVGERYALLPLQTSYELVQSDKLFRKMTNDYCWIHGREVILERGKIIPDPAVKEVDDELQYFGSKIKVEINENDVIDTLMKAGLFIEPKEKICRGCIRFSCGESSVASNWSHFGKSFTAEASGDTFGANITGFLLS